MSSIYLKDRQGHFDEGRVSDRFYSLKNRRCAYAGKITENIKKLMKYMNTGIKSSLEFEMSQKITKI